MIGLAWRGKIVSDYRKRFFRTDEVEVNDRPFAAQYNCPRFIVRFLQMMP
jgi:hypothetical protein